MTQGPPPQESRPGGSERWDAVTPAQWARLWEAVRPDAEPHAVDRPTLGEYVVLLRERGPLGARLAFPAVAAHLAAGCPRCEADLAELAAFADDLTSN